MSTGTNERTCFVIMPFGDKINIDGKMIDAIVRSGEKNVPIDPGLVKPIEFDKIYKYIIEKAADRVGGLRCIRCDKIAGAGSIHEDMFRHIWEDDVVIVDISTLNANVFYELGMRHALHRKVTVLIQRKGTTAPFNIQGYRIITYDETDVESVDNAIQEIAEFVRTGLDTDRNDSPVYKHIPNLETGLRAAKPAVGLIATTNYYEYVLDSGPDTHLGLVTGDLRLIKGIDVWVNSENRNMQMARYYDRSISGLIRWMGAKKKPHTNRVVEDTIALELGEIMGDDEVVDAGTVIPTGSGQLLETNGVKRIFHVAAVEAQRGYPAIPDVSPCVTNALALADEEGASAPLESIVFPLLGTGTGRGSVEKALETLVKYSVAYLRNNPGTKIRKIYFLAPTEEMLDTGLAVLNRTAGLSRFTAAG